MELPENVTALLESLQRQIKELQNRGGLTEAAQAEEERLQEMRRDSRFQGLGKPMKNPNERAGLKYPGFRYHISGAERIVERPDQEPKGDGWYSTMAEYQAAVEAAKADETADLPALTSEPLPALKVDGRSKAAREAKKQERA